MNDFGDGKGRPQDAASESPPELEASLRSLRPRAPELDLDLDLARLETPLKSQLGASLGDNTLPANFVEAPLPCPSADTGDAVQAMPISAQQQNAWGTVATALVCGALVGGLSVFVLMQNRVAALQSLVEQPAQDSVVVLSPPASPPFRPSVEVPEAADLKRHEAAPSSIAPPMRVHLDAGTAYATSWSDPHGRTWPLWHEESRTALKAGSHLRPFVDRRVAASFDEVPAGRSSERASAAAADVQASHPQPPVTRASLLEELLDRPYRTL